MRRLFEQLKKALSKVPVLGLLDFSNPLVLETNASSHGIEIVLS